MAAVIGPRSARPTTPAGGAGRAGSADSDRRAGSAGRPRRRRHATPLQVALVVSATLHLVVLGMQLARPGRPDRTPQAAPLEIVLVNARSEEKPAAPRVVAQASLAGGGNADQGRATSPLPPAPQARPGDDAADAPEQVVQAPAPPMELLAQLRRELALLPPPEETPDDARAGGAEAIAREARRRELVDLLASLERRVNERTEGVRRHYIGPSAVEAVYAAYYDQLRRRIEEQGTRDFPHHQGRKLYGELTMNLVVDAQGRVVETEIVRGSSQRQLDRHAVAIVKSAAPFGAFTPAMRRQADELVVTSRFRFTRDDGLETTLAAPR